MKFFPRGLAVLFLAQFALFWQYAQREIVWAYPGNFDQASYLFLDYSLYRDALQVGLLPALWAYLHQPHPTGLMLPLQDCVLHFFAGPGRSSDLLLNFAYFVLLEGAVFATARWLSGRQVFGWLGCGLLTLQQSAFLHSGGLFDCRIDFVVYCLYGLFVCLLIRSDGLRDRRWLAAAAACGFWMVSFRFITFTYLLGFCVTLFTALLGWRLLAPGRWKEHAAPAWTMRRTAALGAAFAVAGGTLVALNWRSIHDYYVVGHFTGNEKHVRAVEAGITDLAGHLFFYAASLLRDHLGATFIITWLAVAGGSLALGLAARAPAGTGGRLGPAAWDSRRTVQLLVVGSALFSPWFILTLDEAKSPVVANVLAVPALLLLFVLVTSGHREPLPGDPAPVQAVSFPRRLFWRVAAAVAMALGTGNWLAHLARGSYISERRDSMQQISALYDTMGEQSRLVGLETPLLASDVVYDWAAPAAITTGLYERTGQWLDLRSSPLGSSMFALTRAQIMAALDGSDIVLLTSFPKEGSFPVYDSIRQHSGEMRAWCEDHLLHVRDFSINGGQVVLYVRPKVTFEGLSGDWITPAGIHVTIPGEILDWMRLKGKKSLVMYGHENEYLPALLTASARLTGPNVPPGNAVCAVDFTLPARDVYQLRFDLTSLLAAAPTGGPGVDIELHLDGADFVPSQHGPGGDTRHLVVTRPSIFRFE